MKINDTHKQLEKMQIRQNQASANPKRSARDLFGQVAQRLRLGENLMGSPNNEWLRIQTVAMA